MKRFALFLLLAACAHAPVQTSALPELEAALPGLKPVAGKPILLASADVGTSVRDWYVSKLLQQPYDPWTPTFLTVTAIGSGTSTFTGPISAKNFTATAAASSFSFSSTAAGANITPSTSAANAGATPATAAFSIFPQSALDSTDYVFNVANAANATSLFNVAYNGAVTFPVSANPLILNVLSTGNIKLNARMAIDVNAPTISSGFGSSPSIVNSNGTLAFQINVGTGGVATNGVIGFPSSATNGWNCFCEDITTPGANRTRMTANSTTTCTITNVAMSTGSAAAWTASDKLWCSAFAN